MGNINYPYTNVNGFKSVILNPRVMVPDNPDITKSVDVGGEKVSIKTSTTERIVNEGSMTEREK